MIYTLMLVCVFYSRLANANDTLHQHVLNTLTRFSFWINMSGIHGMPGI